MKGLNIFLIGAVIFSLGLLGCFMTKNLTYQGLLGLVSISGLMMIVIGFCIQSINFVNISQKEYKNG